jgi:outer membrane protein OmpA-like peptidoglycan-associated protein
MRSPSRTRGRVALLGLFSAVIGSSGCAEAPRVRGQIAGLEKLTEQAERNGAIRCAPRELAIAKSQLEFARLELLEGSLSRAKEHVWLATPNANAATFLSPPQYCAERTFIDKDPNDRDGDGHPDDADKCPDQPENYQGFEDDDGCPDDPDTDGDGRPDSVDSCVLEPEDVDKYLDEDGCPDPDNDLDTVPDTTDKCPLEPEDPDGYEDDDGCPDLDNDKDEVPDVTDQCPNTAGSTTQDPIGCPTSGLVIVTDCEVKITQQIHFEYNKAKIRPESFPVLDAVSDVLRKTPTILIEVQGHTDNKGGSVYNKRLSEQRATSVRQYLVQQGVESVRLASHGYGFDRPLVPNDSDQNRALNRRVQFVRTEGSKEGCPQASK